MLNFLQQISSTENLPCVDDKHSMSWIALELRLMTYAM